MHWTAWICTQKKHDSLYIQEKLFSGKIKIWEEHWELCLRGYQEEKESGCISCLLAEKKISKWVVKLNQKLIS